MLQLFEQSSQFRKWMFTDEKLSELRSSTFNKSIERCRLLIEEEEFLTLMENGSSVSEETARSAAREKASKIEFIKQTEQSTYLSAFESKVFDYGKVLKLHKNVQETAIMFIKRYYLLHTILEDDPKTMLIAAIFLAMKTENTSLGLNPLDEFLRNVPNPPSREVVIEQELRLSQGLNFEFSVKHLSWSLHGFYLDIQAYVRTISAQSDKQNQLLLADAYPRALKYLDAANLTDVTLTHWPSQIALACLIRAAKEQNAKNQSFEELMNRYLNEKFKDEQRWAGVQEILRSIKEKLVNNPPQQINKAALKEISERLNGCRNPEFIRDSRV
ncbi:hypothetical protein HK098_005812 [Nowakowskiella sp. JEL0407]|nr:hypothetical protein HK098_005812 [Nowakowskiella sp. JEL0407]